MNQPTPTLNLWPLVVVIEDCFIPELAPLVMEVCAERTEELCKLVITCWANEASVVLTSN